MTLVGMEESLTLADTQARTLSGIVKKMKITTVSWGFLPDRYSLRPAQGSVSPLVTQMQLPRLTELPFLCIVSATTENISAHFLKMNF